jgi:hypothetical protein
MAAVAISSFWIFEIRRGAGPSWIHVLSVWTLISLALAVGADSAPSRPAGRCPASYWLAAAAFFRMAGGVR